MVTKLRDVDWLLSSSGTPFHTCVSFSCVHSGLEEKADGEVSSMRVQHGDGYAQVKLAPASKRGPTVVPTEKLRETEDPTFFVDLYF